MCQNHMSSNNEYCPDCDRSGHHNCQCPYEVMTAMKRKVRVGVSFSRKTGNITVVGAGPGIFNQGLRRWEFFNHEGLRFAVTNHLGEFMLTDGAQ